jgi:3'(2'), 5'-bisphosphate nucleotidase
MTDLSRPEDRRTLLTALTVLAIEAGAEIMRIFEAGFEVETKSDASPVTIADRAAEAVILKGLAALLPHVPVVAEEEASAGRTPKVDDVFFLVDPLDGTKEFVRRGTDFTVNIGLIEGRVPTMGVVYAPARGELYAGDATLSEAFWRREGQSNQRLAVRAPASPPTALASKSHDVPATEAYLLAIGSGGRISIGSSLKFCLLARGDADIYPRPSPTMEWDTAAGHAVLIAAGGQAHAPEGGPLLYAKPDFFNPGFVASGPLAAPPIGPFMLQAERA